MDKKYLIDFRQGDKLGLKFLKGVNEIYRGWFVKKNTCRDYIELFIKWVSNKGLYYDKEKQNVHKEYDKPAFRRLDYIDYTLLRINPLDPISTIWDFRYTDANSIFSNKSYASRVEILYTTLTIAQGNFKNATLYKLGPMYFMATFYISLEDKSFLVFSVLPERYIEEIARDPKIRLQYPWAWQQEWQWRYHQYIRFLGVVKSLGEIDNALKDLLTSISTWINRYEIFLCAHNLRLLPFFNSDEKQTLNDVVDMECKTEGSVIMDTGKVKPRLLDYCIKINDIHSLAFGGDAGSWMNRDEICESIKGYNAKVISLVRY